MSDVLKYEAQIPVAARPEVLVVGAGPAGWAAAIAARRAGSQVILMDRCGTVGGVATLSGVNLLSAVRTLRGEATFPGATAELIERMKERGPEAISGGGEGVAVQTDQLAYCMMEMLREAGVELWLHTQLIDTLSEGQRITTAIVHNKSGLLAICPQVVVDCTGDGDVAFSAGVPFTKGRPSDGRMQPVSVMVELGNVDVAKASGYNNRAVALQELGAERAEVAKLIPADLPGFDLSTDCLPLPQGRVLFAGCPRPGEVVLNMTRVLGIDGTRGKDVSSAEVIARRQMMVVLDLLRRFVPGFENAWLQRASALLGVRQTRTIAGRYTLTGAEVLQETHFEDGVAFGSYPVDVHNPDGGGVEWVVPERPYYEIPYRCLLPQGCGNLLVAGRAISADHEALASARIMGTCASTGQAGGIAAALAAQRDCAPETISARDVYGGLSAAFDFRGWER